MDITEQDFGGINKRAITEEQAKEILNRLHIFPALSWSDYIEHLKDLIEYMETHQIHKNHLYDDMTRRLYNLEYATKEEILKEGTTTEEAYLQNATTNINSFAIPLTNIYPLLG